MEEVEPGPAAVLQAQGAGPLGTFLFGVLPQIQARPGRVHPLPIRVQCARHRDGGLCGWAPAALAML